MNNEIIDRENVQREKEHFEKIMRESDARQTKLESEINKNNFESMSVEKQLETIMINYTTDKGKNYADIYIKKYVDEKFYNENFMKFHRAIKDMEDLENSSNYYEFVEEYRKKISDIIDTFINNIRPEIKINSNEFEKIKERLNSTSPLVQNITQITRENNESKKL